MVRLIGRLNLVSGGEISHPWDANAYLITGDEPVLIDCGGSEGYPALKRNLRRLGYVPGDVRRVVATHGHWDHLSAMARIREESDARLFVHAADREQVETGDPDLTASFLALRDQDLPRPRRREPVRDRDESARMGGAGRLSPHHAGLSRQLYAVP